MALNWGRIIGAGGTLGGGGGYYIKVDDASNANNVYGISSAYSSTDGSLIVQGIRFATDNTGYIAKYDIATNSFDWVTDFKESGADAQMIYTNMKVDSSGDIIFGSRRASISPDTASGICKIDGSDGTILFMNSLLGPFTTSQNGTVAIDSNGDYYVSLRFDRSLGGGILKVNTTTGALVSGVTIDHTSSSYFIYTEESFDMDGTDIYTFFSAAYLSTSLSILEKFNSSGTRQYSRNYGSNKDRTLKVCCDGTNLYLAHPNNTYFEIFKSSMSTGIESDGIRITDTGSFYLTGFAESGDYVYVIARMDNDFTKAYIYQIQKSDMTVTNAIQLAGDGTLLGGYSKHGATFFTHDSEDFLCVSLEDKPSGQTYSDAYHVVIPADLSQSVGGSFGSVTISSYSGYSTGTLGSSSAYTSTTNTTSFSLTENSTAYTINSPATLIDESSGSL